MRVLRTIVAVALLGGALLSAVSTPVNAAGRKTFLSQLTKIRDDTDQGFVVEVSGKVTSQKRECIAGRTVRVRLNDVDVAFGSGTTDSAGNFAISGAGPRDQDYRITLVNQRVRGFRCSGDVVVDDLG